MNTPHSTATDTTIDDPFLLDNEHIEALADPGRIRARLQLSTGHAVTALDRHETGLWAEVENAESGDKLQADITIWKPPTCCSARLPWPSPGSAARRATGCRRAEIWPGRTARRSGSRRVDLR